MNKLILVESIQVGKFFFRGYIVDKGEGILAYSIFVDTINDPFIEMIADLDRNVSFVFNPKLIEFININKTADKRKRREYYKNFYDFIIASEKKAAYMVFKKQKLNYIKKSAEIVNLKKLYLAD